MAEKEVERIGLIVRKRQTLANQNQDAANPIKFVEQKNQHQLLLSTVKNWERKIEIAEIAVKKARMTIKKAGQDFDGDIDDHLYN